MSIKDKITPGEWYHNSHFCFTETNETNYRLGMADVGGPNDLPQAENNAKLWAASKSMLNIIERLAKWSGYDFADVEPDESAQEIAHEAKQLLNELNK